MKIGLIAMSGIRACDPELLRLGLTLPGFIERSKTIASLPSLGLLTLAALVPERHELEYVEVADLTAMESIPTHFDLVAISSFSAQIEEAYALADRFRAVGIRVVLGGPHVSALPDEALQHADAIVIGEGEPLWPALLQDAEAGQLKHVYNARGIEYDLAQAPIPAFHLLDINRYNRLTVQTSRGCPHRCEFCAASPLLTERYKQKSVEKVVAEIDRIFEIWPEPFIEFADDNAFVNHKYWRRLLEALDGPRFRWFAESDVSVSRDRELLRLMRRSGCAQVLIGLESPIPTGLPGLEMKRDWKRKKQAEYREVVDRIQSEGITVNGCFIIGLDGHTTEIFDAIYEFAGATALYDVQITMLTPFPGTPLYARLAREKRLIEPTNWKKCTLFDLNFIPSHMTPEELTEGFRRLAVDLYGEEFTRRRRGQFRRNFRAARREGVVSSG